jgi:hypothetical protein
MKRSVTKKPKLTKWFDGEKVVPAHVGVYEVRQLNAPRYQYWNGNFWGFRGIDLDYVKSIRNSRSTWQNPMWRGLAVKP